MYGQAIEGVKWLERRVSMWLFNMCVLYGVCIIGSHTKNPMFTEREGEWEIGCNPGQLLYTCLTIRSFGAGWIECASRLQKPTREHGWR